MGTKYLHSSSIQLHSFTFAIFLTGNLANSLGLTVVIKSALECTNLRVATSPAAIFLPLTHVQLSTMECLLAGVDYSNVLFSWIFWMCLLRLFLFYQQPPHPTLGLIGTWNTPFPVLRLQEPGFTHFFPPWTHASHGQFKINSIHVPPSPHCLHEPLDNASVFIYSLPSQCSGSKCTCGVPGATLPSNFADP